MQKNFKNLINYILNKQGDSMSKLKLGVLFGGMSSEHDVSITSGTSVIKNLNKDKYEITYYLQNADEGQDEDLVQSVLNSGAKIIVRDHSKQGYVSGLKDAVKIMKKNKYDIVHSHVVFYNGIIMLAAKISGIKKRIAHSHARMWNRKETLPFK